ncbi:family 16 glycosylhydrolase [Zobellia galactanivorans]|uniref:family 16 glycosylhydrolase n=1 Tax=Zobellia galactanivorans (strain DSM 12802 / CCUG 47099 / CIP 106680 / NCIMB 13871 / Dsij) TaxID=63186 RepID=UPI001C0769DD|nr:family 16 glycosylhydrolase [Zobellia galactanivorans]MBU3024290.1 family 16 glycosylhydrolase [Zobellia galactanivorans]
MGNTMLLTLLLVVVAAYGQTPPPPEGFRWVKNESFSDEFDGEVLDTTKWYARSPYWVNGRPPATFRAGSVSVKEGMLQIKNSVLDGDKKYNIAGGAVASVAKDALYGYYEARMKASSISMSSTFWMKNKPDTKECPFEVQELDIVEVVGQQKTGWDFRTNLKSNTHIFYTDCDGEKTVKSAGGTEAKIDPPANEAYHVYGCWWVDADTIKIYLDGEYQFTMNPSTHFRDTPFNKPMYMHMVTETYNWETPPTPEELADDTKNTTYYDWVRSYTLVPVDQ